MDKEEFLKYWGTEQAKQDFQEAQELLQKKDTDGLVALMRKIRERPTKPD